MLSSPYKKMRRSLQIHDLQHITVFNACGIAFLCVQMHEQAFPAADKGHIFEVNRSVSGGFYGI